MGDRDLESDPGRPAAAECTGPTMLLIVPTYGAFAYAERAVRSAFANTRAVEPSVCVVDDASPGWDDDWASGLTREFDRLMMVRFPENGGLTRGWNEGLSLARALGVTYAVATNSDVLFAPSWDVPLVEALDSGWDLVGPVTNAPGAVPGQHYRNYLPGGPGRPGPAADDSAASLDAIADALRRRDGPAVVAGKINGFCMAARTATWWQHAFDDRHVFRPRNDFDSRGRPNPTPLMTLNEDELQARWSAAGLKIGRVPGSYVFHYRSATRGDAHKGRHWYRAEGDR